MQTEKHKKKEIRNKAEDIKENEKKVKVKGIKSDTRQENKRGKEKRQY